MNKVLRSRSIGRSASLEEGHRLHDAISFDDESSPEVDPDSTADWSDMLEILGDEMLSDIVGGNPTFLRCLIAGEPDPTGRISKRLDWMARLVTDLLRADSRSEIREWFDGPLTKPGGACPRDILGGGFEVDGAADLKVMAQAISFIKLRQGGQDG